jgi:AcrR family transcriptional regulator
MPRKYDMTKRTNSAENTNEKILEATEFLLATGPLVNVTLPAIAKGAKVTVQTIMRHMGSREGCLAAVAEKVTKRIESQRGQTKPGDINAAISVLMDHYESENSLILNLLEKVNKAETFAKRAAETGRTYHRNWVKHCFGPLVDDLQEETVDALVAATDIYLYKLLRLDMGRSFEDTKAVIKRLVRGILEVS